jgi:hypothetical protein
VSSERMARATGLLQEAKNLRQNFSDLTMDHGEMLLKALRSDMVRQIKLKMVLLEIAAIRVRNLNWVTLTSSEDIIVACVVSLDPMGKPSFEVDLVWTKIKDGKKTALRRVKYMPYDVFRSVVDVLIASTSKGELDSFLHEDAGTVMFKGVENFLKYNY